MKIPKLLTTALVAVGAGLSALPLHAALTTNTGDLYLGFRQGDSKGYLVNLGSIAQYSLANGASFTVNTGGNIGLDLASSNGFGATWAQDETVFWGAVGTTYDGGANPSPVLYATRPRASANVPATPWVGRSTSGQIGTASNFQALAGKYGVEGQATANSTRATFQGSGANTWTSFTAPPADFLVFPGIEGNFSSLSGGAAGSVLDFFQINPGSGTTSTYLGSFTIRNAGVITFTAVPEPGTVALVALAGLLVLAQIRRRSRLS